MYPYEGMFLVDPAQHGSDPEGVEGTVKGLLEKHGAKIHDFERWDERKLAYEIKGHKRGVYLLSHFEIPGDNVVEFNNDCRITDCILRQMLVRLEDEIPVYLEKSAQYHEKMREDQEARRSRREDGDSRESRDSKEPRQPAGAASGSGGSGESESKTPAKASEDG